MPSRRLLPVFILLLLLALHGRLMAQSSTIRWSVGFRGGASVYFSDYNQTKVGGAGDFLVRYGPQQGFSLGLMGGYEELKAGQDPPLLSEQYKVKVDYIKLQAFPISAVAMYGFGQGLVVPYVYAGVGAMAYRRLVNADTYLPDDSFLFSAIVPAGVGVETFISSRTAVAVDLGVRAVGGWLDLRDNASPDSYVTAKAGLQFYFGSTDTDDDDGDGLTNGEERRYGTNPRNPDTDGDGLSDGDEVKVYKTNPLKADTDGDGLLDGEEIVKYRTDPVKFDMDGDGLSDGEEVMKYHTDPTRPDTDGDGLTDGDEILKYHTDPLKVDTDGDGLTDGDEVMVFKTDPNNPDTDGDGLSDSEEVRRYRTDPLKADTDGGGVPDGEEVRRGTNPLDPRDDVRVTPLKLEHGKSVILKGVNFESGGVKLTPGSEPVLRQALEALQQKPDLVVEIAGYTDDRGKLVRNEVLSLRRAEAVKAWLVNHGISPLRLSTTGMGPRDPIAPNTSAEGRARNRRIEFHVK